MDSFHTAPDVDPEDQFNDESTAVVGREIDSASDTGEAEAHEQRLSRRFRADISLTEGRYAGKKGTRKSLRLDDSEEDVDQVDGMALEDDSLSDDSDALAEVSRALAGHRTKAGSSAAELEQLEAELREIEQDEQNAVQDLQRDTARELQKAKASRNQLSLWDSLLGLRIRLQSGLSLANRMPHPSAPDSVGVGEFSARDDGVAGELDGLCDGLESVVAALVSLRHDLSRQRADVPDMPPRKRRRADDLDALWDEIDGMDAAFTPYRDKVLDKWYRRVHVLTPEAAKKFRALSTSFADQVAMSLRDKERLVRRTQQRRAVDVERVLGFVGERGEVDVEVFDDTDFYQHLLKELIDRGGGGDGPVWLDPTRRQRKQHRSVDRTASKGRKLRYTVMDKLVNFMAPRSMAGSGAPDPEVVQNLISSLFGRK